MMSLGVTRMCILLPFFFTWGRKSNTAQIFRSEGIHPLEIYAQRQKEEVSTVRFRYESVSQ